MRDLPTGTVTFLFTDIEGNTPLFEQHPRLMSAALEVHNQALRQAIEAHGGIVFKIVGDAFQAVFSNAQPALQSAIAAQRRLQTAPWNELGPLKVRMGLHTGEAHPDDIGDEYAVSHTKNRVARIESAGHGGQILLSQETTLLVERELDEGVMLKDLGEHRLKGMLRPEHIYQVVAPGLQETFPPIASQAETPHNLPIQRTSFIGREGEIGQVTVLLDQAALVTIIGTGGVGKTRLALKAAETITNQFPDGAWLVDLAALSNPEQVMSTAARAIGLHVDSGTLAQEVLLKYCQKRQLLLLLDNCEHLVEACARLAEAILTTCPKVKILATSREMLGVPGEAVYPLSPFPAPGAEDSLECLYQNEGMRLFVERAAKLQPAFTLTAHNAPAVGRICAQLDGIPLALELAAAWVRLLPVEQIGRRLKENIDFLRGASRTALPRHQTMRGCLDWSYNLLSPDEQNLLQALSGFAGSWTLEAAEAVCAQSCTSQMEVLELLNQLALKSLILVEHNLEIETRYRLLEPVRQYTQEKLHTSGKAELVRDNHLVYYQGLAEQAALRLRSRQHIAWLRRLERELPNLRQALDWAYSEHGPMERVERGLLMAADLRDFWTSRNRTSEGTLWLERLLDLEQQRRGDQPLSTSMSLARAWALTTVCDVGLFLDSSVDLEGKSYQSLDECIALFRQLGEAGRRGLAYARFRQATLTPFSSLERAVALLQEIYAEAEDLDDKFLMTSCLYWSGVEFLFHGDFDLAERSFQKALELSLEVGDWSPGVKSILAETAFGQGDLEKARSWIADARRSLLEFEADNLHLAKSCYIILGKVSWRMGDYFQAELDCAAGVKIAEAFQKVNFEIHLFPSAIAASQGDYEKARDSLHKIESLPHIRNFLWPHLPDIYMLGELDWAAGEYAQAAKRFKELQRATDVPGFYKILAEWGLAKVALSAGAWRMAADHLALALNRQIEMPIYLDIIEDNYAAVTLSAVLSVALRQFEYAARLLGAADRSYQLNRLTFPLFRRQLIDRAIADTRAALDEAAFTAAWEEGKAMKLDQSLKYALQVVKEYQVETPE